MVDAGADGTMEPSADRGPAAGPALVGVVVLSAVAGVLRATRPLLSGPDPFWHWDLGRRIVGSWLPDGDPYSFLTDGQSWILNQWGTDALIGLVHALGGLWLLAIITALVVASALGLTGWQMWRRSPSLLTVGMLGLVLVATMPAWSLRGTLLTMLLLPVLLRELQRPHGARLPFLLVLFVVWANLHAGFLIGAGVAGLFLLGQALTERPHASGLRRVGLLAVAAVIAGVVTPYGPRYLASLWEVATRAGGAGISEWGPTPLLRPQGLPFTLLAVLVLVALGVVGRRRDLPDVLVVVCTTVLGAAAARNAAPASIVIAIVGVRHVHRAWDDLRQHARATAPHRLTRLDRAVAAIAGTLGVLALLGVAPRSGAIEAHAAGVPLEIIRALDQLDRPARVATTSGWAPAVAGLTSEDVRIAVDGRLELFTDEQIDQLRALERDGLEPEGVLEEWCTTDVVAVEGSPLEASLSDSDWHRRSGQALEPGAPGAVWFEAPASQRRRCLTT